MAAKKKRTQKRIAPKTAKPRIRKAGATKKPTDGSLQEEFVDFLGSFKNSEGVSASLREAIAVPTGLEEAIVSSVFDRPAVILTGAAGSGKTHLLSGLTSFLPPDVQLVCPVPERSGQFKAFHRVLPRRSERVFGRGSGIRGGAGRGYRGEGNSAGSDRVG